MLKKPWIVQEGYPFIAAAAAVTFIFAWQGWWHWAVVPFLLTFYFVFFFRCPHRDIPEGEDMLVSPANGKVMEVVNGVQENMFIGAPCHKITIFLSVFDVHVNRAPMAGTIQFQSYTQGRFRPAYKDGVGYENERCAIGIVNSHRSILVIQIAGILARRIVSWKNLGASLQKGELYGMIKFGSCTEVYIPGEIEIAVKPGDQVKGGSTIIGRLKE